MPDRQPEGIIAFSTRLYRLLLGLYPQAHRRDYGPLMVQAFRDLCRDAYRSGGDLAIAGLWCHTLVDLGTTATREHLAGLRQGGWSAMQRHPLGRATLYAVTYLGLLLPSFVTFALAWHWLVEDVLYHHWDTAIIGDFFPPFIDPLVPTDYYIASEGSVYLVWYLFRAAVFLAPALVIWLGRNWRLRGRPAADSPAGLALSLLPALLALGMFWIPFSLWDYDYIRDLRLHSVPGLATLVRGPAQALSLAWLAVAGLLALTRSGEDRRLPVWAPTATSVALALTVGAPLYFLLGQPALFAALVAVLVQPPSRARVPWPVWLALPALLGPLLAPLPGMDRLWGLATAGITLLAVTAAPLLSQRFGRRAGLPVLVVGLLLWELGFELTYTPWRVHLPHLRSAALIPFAFLLLVASPVWLLRILPRPQEPQQMQETGDA